jgi:DNA modification methylase
MAAMPDNSVDSIVCDPPYGLSSEPDMMEVIRHWMAGDDYTHTGAGFMGKSWDSFVPGPSVWREAMRVLKPGGHLLAFFGSRTYDMGTLAIRMAGFEIRDCIQWIYGSGFPKSHDVSKGIEAKLITGGSGPRNFRQRDMGDDYRPHVLAGSDGYGDGRMSRGADTDRDYKSAPLVGTPEAQQWQGWGTALKPAHEPICVARKPLIGTVAQNVLQHGTGAINVDGCRVGVEGARNNGRQAGTNGIYGLIGATTAIDYGKGRWPANVIHDGSDEVIGGMIESARFFYCAKASKSDRNEGLDGMPDANTASSEFRPNHAEKAALGEDGNPYGRWKPTKNNHPTVKPTDLMRYLCRLVTPLNGTVLDPFTGSGSTGKAAVLEGFNFIGAELSDEYASIARARIAHAESMAAKPPAPRKPTPTKKKDDNSMEIFG